VGPEGVKPSPHRVKAGHASLHFDPVLLSLRFAFSFALHGHTSTIRLSISGHTSPVARTHALDTRFALSGLPLFTHLFWWARLESNQLGRWPRRLQRRSLPGDDPRTLKRRKPPRLHRAASREKPWKIRPLRHLLLIAECWLTRDAIRPGFARAKHRLNG